MSGCTVKRRTRGQNIFIAYHPPGRVGRISTVGSSRPGIFIYITIALSATVLIASGHSGHALKEL